LGSAAADVPSPTALYTSADLLGGWTADDPLSYAGTLDARVFRAAWLAGLRTPRDPEVARRRALHDHAITVALNALIEGERVVAVMGGYRLTRDSAAYALVADVARSLAARGYLVVSGGGPGAMEAALLGARLAGVPAAPEEDLRQAIDLLAAQPAFPAYELGSFIGGPDGRFEPDLLRALHAWQAPAFAVADRWPAPPSAVALGIPTWMYGHEPPTPLATLHAKYFNNSLREDGLLSIAKAGVIFAEGSAGTLQEVFQDAAQNYYLTVDDTRSPMVFLDLAGFWTRQRPVRELLDGLFGHNAGQLLHFVTTREDAVEAIASAPAPQETPPLVPGRPPLSPTG
jgi:predicted Rossmann-fold nucleotide-binding protein